MSSSATDFYHQKTDDELLFFVQNPGQYEPSVVEAARCELTRRGAAPQATASAPAPYVSPPVAPASPVGKIVALGLIVVALGGGTYWLKQRDNAQVAAVKARQDARRNRPAPKLVEVATNAIPSYDGVVANAVAEQLGKIPAQEKANPQHLRQFRELAKRFWAAQAQSEYLIDQATAGKANPMFGEQTVVARQTWTAWNHAAVYTYNFGPEMAQQVEHMGKVASNQQHILDSLPDLLADNKYKWDKEMLSRTAEVEDLMASILPVSPVSGRQYKRTVLRM
ncbi:hypothetical protein BEN47_11415 [Hymenobacter lapidarius]|uniref:Uncharacterized protein n=1 Tax=Hymenobacter lapidarius TaxID=1908237 RepID=A0A1G1T8T1_9BACT|nr:hypothetical protein [Hymenobacter lapidarius]OGX87268.1 hypothetical protein BEN47_11415 [Hymenobacter lapidarius]